MVNVFTVTIVILLGTIIDVLAFPLQGVVNSSIAIQCNIPEGFDTETVRWFFNSSTKTFLSYFPKDNLILPTDHDPRLLITDIERLDISNLRKSDAGEYKCRVTSTLPLEDVESVTNVIVLDGCVMWEYSPPLMATNKGCLSGDVVAYAQQCGFTCPQGFRLVGNAYTECHDNGELANDRPNCEEVTCMITNLSPHLTDRSNTCIENAHVRDGTICDFECSNGYKINGTGTIRIICGDGHTPVFPQCEIITEESFRQNTWYIAVIVILLVFIGIGICAYVWSFRRKNEESNEKRDAEGNGNRYPLNTTNDQTNCQDDGNTDENTVLLITTYKGFMDLLRELIGERSDAMIKVLHTLQQAELRNMPKLSKMQFGGNKAFAKESVLDAFVWYVAEIVRCIDQLNPRLALELTSDIIYSVEDIAPEGSKKTGSVRSLEQLNDSQSKMTKSYFEVVHSAFMDFLVALRHNIEDTKVLKEKTTNVTKMMKLYFRDKKEETLEEEESEFMSKERTPSNWAGSSNGTDFFAKMCVQYIDKCFKFNDRISMRYNVLNIMIDETNGNKTYSCFRFCHVH